MFEDESTARAPGPFDEAVFATVEHPVVRAVDDRPVPASKTLAALTRGTSAVVTRWLGADRTLSEKLASRGIVPGATVRVLQHGNPVMLKVEDTRWAISATDAAHVAVDPLPAEPGALRKGISRLWRR